MIGKAPPQPKFSDEEKLTRQKKGERRKKGIGPAPLLSHGLKLH